MGKIVTLQSKIYQMKDIHSYWAYVVLAILIIAVVNNVAGLFKKKEFKDTDLRLSLFALIVSHIQLIIGLAWYFMSPYFEQLTTNTSDVMKIKELRLLALEHPIMMILAIVFITIGWSKHKKKTTSNTKFKTLAIFYGLGLLLILSRIPWTNWFN